jgi:hypothetical protein
MQAGGDATGLPETTESRCARPDAVGSDEISKLLSQVEIQE